MPRTSLFVMMQFDCNDYRRKIKQYHLMNAVDCILQLAVSEMRIPSIFIQDMRHPVFVMNKSTNLCNKSIFPYII